ncbi:hypothetical protein JCM15579A_21830 [Marinifilum fragile]
MAFIFFEKIDTNSQHHSEVDEKNDNINNMHRIILYNLHLSALTKSISYRLKIVALIKQRHQKPDDVAHF